jgi:adenylate cyclase
MKKILALVWRHLPRMSLSLAIIALFLLHSASILRLPLVDTLENRLYDLRLNSQLSHKADPRVVIADIDEESLAEIGRWPWGRDRLARLVNELFDRYKINLLAFDVMFVEPDASSGLSKLVELAAGPLQGESNFIAALEKIAPSLNYDELFRKSLQNRRVVMGYSFLKKDEGNDSIGQLPPPAFTQARRGGVYGLYPNATGYVANLAAFSNAAESAGHFNAYPDSDGILRRINLLYDYKGNLYESLALAVARMYLGIPQLELEAVPGGGLEQEAVAIKLDSRRIPVDREQQTLIPYQGKGGSFPYVSISDILKGKADPDVLDGAIVLVGATAAGLYDLRATPVQEVYPGVEIHANLIAGILDNTILRTPYSFWTEFYILLACGVLMAYLVSYLSPVWSTLATMTLVGAVLSGNLWAWIEMQMVVPLASSLLLVLMLFLFNMSYGYFVELRGKRQALKVFGQYVPPQLVDELSKNPDLAMSLEGDSRELTVLFSDVRGFTTISEGLNPRELSELMNSFLTPMTHVIHDHRGTIDKYMGDAIMSFWGAPLPDPDHARNALRAALDMVARLQELQPSFSVRGWPTIKIGVGLNTGVMNVGNMGSEFRMAYTVMGDAVNLGSRLEGLTKQYGVYIIVSEFTKAAIPDFVFRELDLVKVKGKDKPVAIFEPLPPDAAPERLQELEAYHAALKQYRAQHWDTAESQFKALAQSENRLIYQVYLDRIAEFRAHPPGAEWDGVFTHKTK